MNLHGTKAPHWPELDGIRCFAVLGVLAIHFIPRLRVEPWGDWGVRIFFALSGFLITLGLIEDRLNGRPLKSVQNFMLRRVFRLWPLYFAVLAITAAFNVRDARTILGWNAAFASNVWIYQHDEWPTVHSHLWTLAIEQQFYIIWPFVILFLRPRLYVGVIVGLIVLSPFLRWWELAGLGPTQVSGILLPMCVDYLAWGALLACWWSQAPRSNAFTRYGGYLSVGLLVGLFFVHQHHFASALPVALQGTALSFTACVLIAHCLGESDSLVRRFLRLRPFVYLGVISYGIYLLHNYSHWIGPALLRRLTGHNYFATESAHVAWLVSLSVLAAALSWHFFERPIARAGRRHLRS